MRLPNKLFYKIYFIIFSWMCLGNLFTLMLPESDAYVYYNIMRAFYKPSGIFYGLALGSAVINSLCLIPLFLFAFNNECRWPGTFKSLLVLRVIGDITGHNYEYQFFKSAMFSEASLAWATLALFITVLIPSYKAHFELTFGPKSNPGRNTPDDVK